MNVLETIKFVEICYSHVLCQDDNLFFLPQCIIFCTVRVHKEKGHYEG